MTDKGEAGPESARRSSGRARSKPAEFWIAKNSPAPICKFEKTPNGGSGTSSFLRELDAVKRELAGMGRSSGGSGSKAKSPWTAANKSSGRYAGGSGTSTVSGHAALPPAPKSADKSQAHPSKLATSARPRGTRAAAEPGIGSPAKKPKLAAVAGQPEAVPKPSAAQVAAERAARNAAAPQPAALQPHPQHPPNPSKPAAPVSVPKLHTGPAQQKKQAQPLPVQQQAEPAAGSKPTQGT
jgi:hypothetical protein